MTASKKKILSEMTSAEVKDYLGEGVDLAVLPVGAIEQHGPHGPLGIDYFGAVLVAERITEKLKAILLPSSIYGASSNHMHFAGTISLRPETLIGLVEDICRSAAHHGFKKLIIVNGHEGNDSMLSIAARRVREETGLIITISNWYNALMDVWRTLPGIAGTRFEKLEWHDFMAHGGLLEIAVTMAYKSDIVRMDLAVTGSSKNRALMSNSVLRFPAWMEEVAKAGSYGDPHGATAQLGQQWAGIAAERIVEKTKQVWETLSHER